MPALDSTVSAMIPAAPSPTRPIHSRLPGPGPFGFFLAGLFSPGGGPSGDGSDTGAAFR